MNIDAAEPSGVKNISSAKRKAVKVSPSELLKTGYLSPGQSPPLVIEPAVDGIDLATYAAGSLDSLAGYLYKHGAILFRNFNLRTAADLEKFIVSVSGNSLEYSDQTSPRHKVRGNIYTSTDYPADQPIFLHNENSYSHAWPMKIFFFCVTPPQQGGETPIADVRKVFQHIDVKIRNRFIEKGWMLARNFGGGVGLEWQTVFQTSDKAAVEEYCSRGGIRYEWRKDDCLRTLQVRPAIRTHPRTGETVWFNHATFFHVSTAEPATRDALLLNFEEEDLPYNTYYGDGARIEPSVLEELREVYRQQAVSFAWEKGDLLMLDNMLTAHGRAPYVPPREVLVGMSELFDGGGKY